MKIVFSPQSERFGRGYWFIESPYDTPDYFAVNRLAEALDAVLNANFDLRRRNLLADGSVK